MKQLNKHENHVIAPSFGAGLRNVNIYYDAVSACPDKSGADRHGVIYERACLIKGVNALSCYCDFIPRPKGRGYRYIQSVRSRIGTDINCDTSTLIFLINYSDSEMK